VIAAATETNPKEMKNTMALDTRRSRLPRLASLIAVLAACLAGVAFSPAPAAADFGIASFDGGVYDANGEPFTQAGGHPHSASTTFLLNTTLGGIFDPPSQPVPDGSMKDVHVDLPPGLVGNPNVTPVRCTAAELAAETYGAGCPADSQVGVARFHLPQYGGYLSPVPVWNMIPQPGAPAQFGMNLIALIQLTPSLRSGDDYGLTISSINTSQALANLNGVHFTFWGTPSDPSHDAERFCGLAPPCASDAAPLPFLTLPTSCPGPVETTLRVDSWQNPGVFETASFLSHDNATPTPNPIGTTG
jgi:hypothetical protein